MTKLSPKLLKESVPYFAENILHMKLHKGQRQVLECDDRFLAIAAPRRWGKSEMMAILSTHMTTTNNDCKVICISRSKPQADELFRKIYRLIMNSILSNSVIRNTQSIIEFDNGSSIESKASRDPDKIRGFSAGLVICDEASWIPDPVFETLFPIVLNTKGKVNGKLVLISTPGAKAGEFYRAFQPNSIYTAFHFTHEDAVFDNDERLLPQSELDREGQRLGFDSFVYKREYLCQWGNSEDTFFDDVGIQKSLVDDIEQIKYGIPDHVYYFGVDVGLSQDNTVIICTDATDKENLKIVRMVKFTGKSTEQIMDILYKEAIAFKPKNVVIDDGKVGCAIISHLKVTYPNIRWSGFNFNTKTKTPLMYDLNMAMCTGIIQMPDNDEIRNELISYCYRENDTGHLKLGGVGQHDDIVTAIALSLKATNVFSKKGGYIIGTNNGILKPPKNSDRKPNKSAKILYY